MPNHVKNILTVTNASEKRFRQICEFVSSEDCLFDFNKIIPMPKELELPECSTKEFIKELYQRYAGFEGDILTVIEKDDLNRARLFVEGSTLPDVLSDEEIIKIAMNYGSQYVYNLCVYGCDTWYQWRVENWGTKWNAYDICSPDDGRGWVFFTAWSAPIPVIEMLSKIFPEVVFNLRYADEDIGFNCGSVEFTRGHSHESPMPSEEFAAMFAEEIWGIAADFLENGDEEEDEEK